MDETFRFFYVADAPIMKKKIKSYCYLFSEHFWKTQYKDDKKKISEKSVFGRTLKKWLKYILLQTQKVQRGGGVIPPLPPIYAPE